MDYIVNKKLFIAVMFARKIAREKECFNKACRIAARYYNVDEDDVAKYLHQALDDDRRKKTYCTS